MSNNIDIDPQICRHLDRLKKCSRFELATSLREVLDHHQDEEDEDFMTANMDGDTQLFQLVAKLGQPKRSPANYFTQAQELLVAPCGSVPVPLRTSVVCNTAISVTRDSKINRSPIDAIATSHNIADLHSVIGDYLQQEAQKLSHWVGGPRYSTNTCDLPFSQHAVWHAVRLQQKPFHLGADLDPTQTVNAAPPSTTWHYGRYDTVVFNVDPSKEWPQSGLEDNSIIHMLPSIDPIPPLQAMALVKYN